MPTTDSLPTQETTQDGTVKWVGIRWHRYNPITVPKDRHIALLSIQPQEGGGHWVSLHIGKWSEQLIQRGSSPPYTEALPRLGFNFDSGVGDEAATHWCEVEALRLPL